jgi:hypothetical protein
VEKKPKNSRKSIRFKPETPVHAWIDTEVDAPEFSSRFPALVQDESFKGCSLVVIETPQLQRGDQIRVKAGDLPVLRAEVRWRHVIDDGVLKIGLLFID